MLKTKTIAPPNNIRELRRAANLTLDQLGEMIGTDASTVNKLEKSRMRLTDRWIEPLTRALETTADILMKSPDGTLTIVQAKTTRDVRAAPGLEIPPAQAMPLDLPVRGTAAGSHLRGAFHLEASVVDYVRRPPALMGAPHAYALYIEGESMVPEHNPGNLRFVHPDRPARIGDSVIVQIQIGPNAEIETTIGRLLKRTEKFVTIGKHNPAAQIDLKRETVLSVHKVLTDNDLFGV